MNICTIIAKNYVAHARVLAESFRAVHQDGDCHVLIIDDFTDLLDPAVEPFELISLDQIGLPDVEQMAASYDVVEFSTAVKPWLLRHLLGRPGIEAITYLDPDIWIADSLAEVDQLARESEIVLTPHFTAPLPRDGLKPSEEDILIAGTYNLGFIALGAGDTADSLLKWWSERLERHCVVDPGNGHFVDQRWIDLVPGLWPNLHILRDPGFNVAYWNLPMRRFEIDGDSYCVDGQPLRFFHFSGFDPLRPHDLSRHQNRIEAKRSPALAGICAAYADALLDNGYREAKAWSYGWDALPNGILLDRPARELHREGIEAGAIDGSVFSRRGSKRFLAYLNEGVGGGGNRSMTRYARAVRDSRPDLVQAFPEIDGRDAAAFAHWLHEHAPELRIADQLLPPLAGRQNGAEPSGGGPRAGALGVNVVGYLGSELGVGEAARQIRSALDAGKLSTASIEVPVDSSRMPEALGGLSDRDLPFEFNLICVNADMLPELAGAASPKLFQQRHSVGLWFWEVAQFPERWRASFDHLDEVWVASEHIADAIRPLSPVPVNTVRIPVTPVAPAKLSRAELGMPDGFCFLFLFDYRSVFKRKNPLGAVEAFSNAFEPGSGASLVIKSMSGDDFPAEKERLAAAAARHPDIYLIDETVDAAVKNAMIESCDCYVSLHRSEGLGLTMAEAMYFGRPVVSTAYSGNLDFMTEENSFLVRHSLTTIGPGADPYPPDGDWAEPDLDHAASLMRQVFEHPEAAADRGGRAATDIRRTHSPAGAGEVLHARLAEVRRQRILARFDAAPVEGPDNGAGSNGTELVPLGPQPLPDGDPASGRAQLHHLLRFDDPPPRHGSGRIRVFLKRLYMRFLRPYASHQRRIDLSTAAAIDELSATLGQAEARTSKATEAMRSHLEDELTATRATVTAIEARTAENEDQLRQHLREARREQEEGLAGLRQETQSRVDKLRSQQDGRFDELRRMQDRHAYSLKRRLNRRDAFGAQQAKAMKARITATTEELHRLSENVDATFDRDRAFVDALRANQEQLSAETETALAELRQRSEEISNELRAANAMPYMAEARFEPRTHPLLGGVLGFSASPEDEADGYRAFEDLFRGPEEMIRERQRVYVDLVAGFAPLLDVGCGRGEFLDLMQEKGIEAHGVDIDRGMVERCREKGHGQVEEADLLDYLTRVPSDSIGTLFSAQVIEHLDQSQLLQLLELGLSRLRPGGLFVAETVNPHSPAALKSFWVDPSHRQPLFPETMLALCQLVGYAAADVFSPTGSGDWLADRVSSGEYAVVAVAPERNA